ncbi:hypothetical protein H5410_020738 [Solanum commersonii]|uniref:Uncharacterized protein n=1 Tax=Solanum commersonii TaxID=4109 RepID=A0A9J5Z9B1_SOLCO|nr:hypothetical protein H5410_020738 [Solanum commersonii]
MKVFLSAPRPLSRASIQRHTRTKTLMKMLPLCTLGLSTACPRGGLLLGYLGMTFRAFNDICNAFSAKLWQKFRTKKTLLKDLLEAN